jgi:hypothetical protein
MLPSFLLILPERDNKPGVVQSAIPVQFRFTGSRTGI